MNKTELIKIKNNYINDAWEDLEYFFQSTGANFAEVGTGDISDELADKLGNKKLFNISRYEIIKE